eukprot:1520164-Rhodomonas_salina.1
MHTQWFTLSCCLASLSLALAAAGCNVEKKVWCGKQAYSSVFQNSRKCSGFAMGVLDAPKGWKPAVNNRNQWMRLDLLFPRTVTGLVTQAARENNHFVSTYWVSYSLDGVKWQR